MIDLVLLGTGAMIPLPQRWLSSLLVRASRSLILFDCGEGTQIPWRTFGWGFKRLDAICLSHVHADHVAGLPGLFHTVANAGRTAPLPIYGPPGTDVVITGLRVIAPQLPYQVVVHELEGGATFELPGGLRGSVAWADHRIPCLAYRCDLPRQPRFDPERASGLGVPRPQWSVLQRGEPVIVDGREVLPEAVLHDARPGVSFGFATDTRPAVSIVDLMQGVDLLISEATYGSDEHLAQARDNKHMTFSEAATMARAAAAKHLWLTHFSPRIADPEAFRAMAANIFPAVEIGCSGLQGTLTFDSGYQRAS